MRLAHAYGTTGAVRWGMRALLVAAALALGLLFGAPTAHACYYGGCAGAMLVPTVIGGSLVGLASVGVLGMDLTYALRGQGQPTDFAVGNVVLGAVDLLGGTLAALGGTDAGLGFGLAFVGARAIVLIDGIVAVLSSTYRSREIPSLPTSSRPATVRRLAG